MLTSACFSPYHAACYPPSTELLQAVIALSAALFIVATLLAVATFTAIWMFQREPHNCLDIKWCVADLNTAPLHFNAYYVQSGSL